MTWQTTMHEAWNLFDNFPLRFISVSRPKHHQAWGLRTDCYLVAFGMIYDVQHVSTSYFTLKFVTYTSVFPLIVISKLMCEVAHMSMTPLSYKVAVCWDGEWSGQCKNSCCRVHFLRTIRPHPLTLSPYAQMLARGIAGALGWIRRPHRGRESRGGHGRGWPATQLPAQVSTGRHEQLFLPLLLIPSMLKAALPPTQIQQWRNWWTNWHI